MQTELSFITRLYDSYTAAENRSVGGSTPSLGTTPLSVSSSALSKRVTVGLRSSS